MSLQSWLIWGALNHMGTQAVIRQNMVQFCSIKHSDKRFILLYKDVLAPQAMKV